MEEGQWKAVSGFAEPKALATSHHHSFTELDNQLLSQRPSFIPSLPLFRLPLHATGSLLSSPYHSFIAAHPIQIIKSPNPPVPTCAATLAPNGSVRKCPTTRRVPVVANPGIFLLTVHPIV